MTVQPDCAARRPAWLRPRAAPRQKSPLSGELRRSAGLQAIEPESGLWRVLGMQNGNAPVVDENAFATWLAAAGAGDRLVYHVGHLGFDRADGSALSRDRRRELARVADRAMALAERGALYLAQQRIDDERVAYLAIKSKGRVQ